MKITVRGSLRLLPCPDCGELHDKAAWPDNHRRPDEVLATPNVIRDDMPPARSMANGQIYDTKSGIRSTYRPDGNPQRRQYEEIGNDPARHKPHQRAKPDKKAIRDSIEKGKARLARGDVTEKTKQKLLTRPGPA